MPSSETSTVDQVGDALFGAIEHSDTAAIAALFDDDVAVWHAGDRRDNDRPRALQVIEWFIGSTTERNYEILDRQLFEGGFVQQHILRATGTTGAVISLRVHRDQGEQHRPDHPYRRVFRSGRYGSVAALKSPTSEDGK